MLPPIPKKAISRSSRPPSEKAVLPPLRPETELDTIFARLDEGLARMEQQQVRLGRLKERQQAIVVKQELLKKVSAFKKHLLAANDYNFFPEPPKVGDGLPRSLQKQFRHLYQLLWFMLPYKQSYRGFFQTFKKHNRQLAKNSGQLLRDLQQTHIRLPRIHVQQQRSHILPEPPPLSRMVAGHHFTFDPQEQSP